LNKRNIYFYWELKTKSKDINIPISKYNANTIEIVKKDYEPFYLQEIKIWFIDGIFIYIYALIFIFYVIYSSIKYYIIYFVTFKVIASISKN